MTGRKVIVLSGVAALLLILGYVRYEQVIGAWLWHKANGDFVNVPHLKMTVPREWFVSSESLGNIYIIKGLPGHHSLSPTIRIETARPEEIMQSDAELRSLVEGAPSTESNTTPLRGAISTKVITSSQRTFYCVRTELSAIRSVSDYCRAPQFGYFLIYHGDLATEGEAVRIISNVKIPD